LQRLEGCSDCCSGVAMGGCAPSHHMTVQPRKMKLAEMMSKFPLRQPCIPGDVLLAGDLPEDVVAELAPVCKGWLYINPDSDPHFYPGTVMAGGSELMLLPFQAGASEGCIHALIEAIDELPRPLVIQCTTANRSGIALLLWLAHGRGYTAACVDRLVKDLGLDTVRPETLSWLREKLPRLDAGDHGPLVEHSPEVRQMWDPQSHTLTYLIHCLETKEAVLIDPVLEHVDRDLQAVQELGLHLKYVIDTHDHTEHTSAGAEIRLRKPDVERVVSTSCLRATISERLVRDREKLRCGNLFIEARATPGQGDGSTAFILQTATANFVFTGDALLVRGCARRSFGKLNMRKLCESVREQIFSLPGETLVCPGHDTRGRSVSTVEEERLFNARFVKPVSDFDDYMAHCKTSDCVDKLGYLPPLTNSNTFFGVAVM